ncbi:hypothetical protein F990_00797 [Acinetobacter tjernbergiae DSM 14971 = CIP 107465]|uniref:Uncharacterized protein n=2 Tax=Acinetobacter tjernbergiae TaxID=202955 RepID=V2V735_9GAMM|nr:hypothetical protein F990_00797 [Acinetobacter tjernbergiae DSM 14971 = CIP 107465]
MTIYFPSDYNPSLHKEIVPIYCPHKFSWLTIICYHQTDENNNRNPLLNVDGDMLFIRDVIATDQYIDLKPLIESYTEHNDVVFISFNALMLRYISLIAQIKPTGIKILCANKDFNEQTPYLTIDGRDMEFYCQEITPECFDFNKAVDWFKGKYSSASIIEFSGLAIRQLVALGKQISEGCHENNPF